MSEPPANGHDRAEPRARPAAFIANMILYISDTLVIAGVTAEEAATIGAQVTGMCIARMIPTDKTAPDTIEIVERYLSECQRMMRNTAYGMVSSKRRPDPEPNATADPPA